MHKYHMCFLYNITKKGGGKMFKVAVDHEKCIGCSACTSVCDNFKVTDGKANPVKSEVEEAGCNSEAKDICPVGAITVEEA